ncbi:phage terminase large subunit family protein [Helicobacter salomonis]|uniref:phage terminase large subunit family protein n=1 Tax=Helicobacter salomonis TaxID=56878 RepID=UPI000CF17BD0|nr:terminase gpA endonuclease subunit [Helicobacter salomonis]
MIETKSQSERLKEIFATAIFIKPRLNLCEWAERYRVLSKESSALFGKWQALSYQREPMECISDPIYQEVVLMWGAQLGKSEILNNAIGYFIHQDPSTILFLLPTEDLAQDYSKRRLTPMFRDTQEVGALIHAREANNTILIKNFKGGNLALVGSNSPSKLSSKPIKVLIVDEADRCENTKEGHSIALAQKRTATYFDRKIIKVSTPTIRGHSIIESEYSLSDARMFYVPCPACGFHQTLDFEGLVYECHEDGKPILESVSYKCIECGALWDEKQKNAAVQVGHWRATNANEHNAHKAGFYLNALYSQFFSLREIVRDYFAAKDNQNNMQVFTNTIEAKPYEPPSVVFREQELFERGEKYTPTTLDDRILFITSATDVQGNRVEIEFKGWGAGYENWGVKHVILHGNTSEGEIWGRLYRELKSIFYTTSGRKLQASLHLIDSGFNTERVYNFVRLDKRFIATKGASEVNAKKEFLSPLKKLYKGVHLCVIGTYAGKAEVFRLLAVDKKGAGFCHFPKAYPFEYFEQLTAEKIVKSTTPNGYKSLRWVKVRERNEGLDLFVLNLAGAKLMKVIDRM